MNLNLHWPSWADIKHGLSKLKIGIIDRYIMRRFIGVYLFTIGLLVLIVIVFDAAEKIDDFLEAHISMWEVITGYYLNFIPYFVNQFSGLITFIAVIFFTSKMAYDTEIIAILSSGVSFNRLMWPYFVAAAMITALALMLNLFLIPGANARRIAFEAEHHLNKTDANSAYAPYLYRQIGPNTIAYIKNFSGETNEAIYFALETYDGGSIVSSLEAMHARFDPETGRWTASKYIHRTYDGERENLVRSEQPLDTLINLSPEELFSVQDLVQTMNSPRLRRFIEQQEAKGSDMVAVFKVENYSRYAYPLSTFILTLIGVSLSSRKVRGGTGLHIGIGIALCFSYIVLMRFASEFAKGGLLPPFIAIWLPNIIYLAIGIYLYRKAPK